MRICAFFLLPWIGLAAGRPLEIDALVDQARGAPAEFAADALIRIAALPGVDKPRKVELLSEAFGQAAGARQPYKRRSLAMDLGGAPRFYLQLDNRIYSQDLDALSLQLRAVEALLPLDARKARDLFSRIPPLTLPRLTCEDYLVYDVSRFYEVLLGVTRNGFTPEEVAKGRPTLMLAQYAAAIASPSQIGPAARLVASAGLNDADFQKLLVPLAGALRRISDDSRSFMEARDAGAAILALAEDCERRRISPLILADAYRVYVVNNLSGIRCAGGPSASDANDFVRFFNERLVTPPLRPIEEREAARSKVEGKASLPRRCEDAECRAMAARYRDLLLSPSGEGWSAEGKSTPEWKGRLEDFFSAMEAWQPSSGLPDAGFFREKSGFYIDLFGLLQGQAGRESAARAALRFLEASRFRAETLAEWFLPVNVLIRRARLDPLGLGWLAAELERSSDPVIALYARLEKIAPRPIQEILPLL